MSASPVFYSIKKFLNHSDEQIINTLSNFHLIALHEKASSQQVKAWCGSLVILRNVLGEFIDECPSTEEYHIIFEYELPRERGRRPDVLLLFKSTIIVLEFKERFKIEQAFIDQVSAYARDLNHYHQYSHEVRFKPVLLMANQMAINNLVDDDVLVLSKDNLFNFLKCFWEVEKNTNTIINAEQWVEGDYLALPSLIQAARLIFNHEPLPSIRRAESAGIPFTLKKLQQVADIAKQNKEHHLALITGVPGAGKTLVGISFVYETFQSQEDQLKDAVLLSGNGPLVEVLQYALNSKVFVQDVHGFLKSYGGTKSKIPIESIFIYDEAQRAWDNDQVKAKRGHNKSEPEDFLTIGAKKSWALMVGLIGEGQEIHLGEESGLAQWNDAIEASGTQWKVCCPSKLRTIFTNASEIEVADELNLTETLRSHVASDVQLWVNATLNGDFTKASEYLDKIDKDKFDVYITRNLDKAKAYIQERYAGHIEKRFGLLASSKDKILPAFGIYNDFMSTKVVKKGPWYIDPPNSILSCCQLKTVMTEFGCQGLELDFPLVAWGDDFIWNGERWFSERITRGATDSYQLRKNSYRVLLSRGRDGMLIFVPDNRVLDRTYQALLLTGINELIA